MSGGIRPLLSVIVPVSDGGRHLGECLAALAASDLPRELWELIVVDDGSLDGTSTIAAGWADVLVRLPGPPHGPAYARNRGVESALGSILVFVDGDVRAHPDTLRRFAWTFASRPDICAVFGSYDAAPSGRNICSQFHVLRSHYLHQTASGNAETFWASCGAVRRGAFAEAGRFDEWHFPRPQIEDIEFGYRLRRLGYAIRLDPAIQAASLRRWTFRSILIADIRERGVPWIRLQLALDGTGRPGSLLFHRGEWIRSGMIGGALLLMLIAIRLRIPALSVAGQVAIGTVIISNHRLYRFFARERGVLFTLAVVPLHLAYYLLKAFAAGWAWLLFHLIGAPSPPPEIQAYAETDVKAWPPLPERIPGSSWTTGGARPSS